MILYKEKLYKISEKIEFKKEADPQKSYLFYVEGRVLRLKEEAYFVIHDLLDERVMEFQEPDAASNRALGFLIEKNIAEDCDPGCHAARTSDWTISAYTYFFKAEDQCFSVNLLFNTSDRITTEEYSALKQRQFDQLSYDSLRRLYSRKYIQPSTSKINRDQFVQQPSYQTVYVLFSYACNLKCTYCFEQKRMGSIHTRTSYLEEMKSYIARITATGTSLVVLYGGEPLLAENREYIENLIDHFKEASDVYFKIITNGVNIPDFMPLFRTNRKKIAEFVITLDGVADVHDSRRIRQDGSGSFREIRESLKMLNDEKFPLTVRINLDEENADCQQKLISDLNAWLPHKQYVRVEYHRVENKSNPDDHPLHPKVCLDLYESLKKSSDIRISFSSPLINKIEEIIQEKPSLPYLQSGYCPIGHQHVIDVDGRVYSCNEAMGNAAFQIDALSCSDFSKSEHSPNQGCLNCRFYPACYGNCYLTNDRYSEKYASNKKCEYMLIEETLRHALAK